MIHRFTDGKQSKRDADKVEQAANRAEVAALRVDVDKLKKPK